MTAAERQTAAVRVLILLEPPYLHATTCGGWNGHDGCTCHPQCQVAVWARHRAAALDAAGLLGPCRRSADGWCYTHSSDAGPVYCEAKP